MKNKISLNTACKAISSTFILAAMFLGFMLKIIPGFVFEKIVMNFIWVLFGFAGVAIFVSSFDKTNFQSEKGTKFALNASAFGVIIFFVAFFMLTHQ